GAGGGAALAGLHRFPFRIVALAIAGDHPDMLQSPLLVSRGDADLEEIARLRVQRLVVLAEPVPADHRLRRLLAPFVAAAQAEGGGGGAGLAALAIAGRLDLVEQPADEALARGGHRPAAVADPHPPLLLVRRLRAPEPLARPGALEAALALS